jgi:hypothetical protein
MSIWPSSGIRRVLYSTVPGLLYTVMLGWPGKLFRHKHSSLFCRITSDEEKGSFKQSHLASANSNSTSDGLTGSTSLRLTWRRRISADPAEGSAEGTLSSDDFRFRRFPGLLTAPPLELLCSETPESAVSYSWKQNILQNYLRKYLLQTS